MARLTQEDGYVEVTVNLYNRIPLLKWIIPVRLKKLRLLFDTYCMVIVSRESGLDFTQIQEMEVDEALAWTVYGAYKSYKSLTNKRPRISVTTAVKLVKGMLPAERERMAEAYKKSREIGELADSYQKARSRDPEGEADGIKKAQGQGSDMQS